MKILSLVFTLIGTTSAFAQNEICYEAVNTEVIQAQQEETLQVLTATRADLRISRSEETSGRRTSVNEIAKMNIQTSSDMTIEIYSILNPAFKSEIPTFSVECDGGSMTLAAIDENTLVANSNRIRGEIKATMTEGCSNADLQFVDLVLKRTECSQVK